MFLLLVLMSSTSWQQHSLGIEFLKLNEMLIPQIVGFYHKIVNKIICHKIFQLVFTHKCRSTKILKLCYSFISLTCLQAWQT